MEAYRFTPVMDPARLLDVARFDAAAYGEKDVPLDVLTRWWAAFPAGVRLALTAQGRIAGAMSAWPLRARTYARLVEGSMTEDTISPLDFEPASGERPRWYISGIAVDRELKANARFLLAFLADGLAALGAESRCDAPDICAVATSAEGERMLRRFGFERRGVTPHGVAFERRNFRDARIGALAGRVLTRA